jgi:hypothetical protein
LAIINKHISVKHWVSGILTSKANASIVAWLSLKIKQNLIQYPPPLKTYFASCSGVETTLTVRGHETKKIILLGHRLKAKVHGKARFVIAFKYEGEKEYRLLVATDLSWRHTDIARVYTLRWLVEVFIQDWKAYGGWSKLNKQRGVTQLRS